VPTTWAASVTVSAKRSANSRPIHADGGPSDGRGFHVNYSNPPLNEAQAGPAVRFAQTMRDQLVASGMQPSTYRGAEGLYGRADLAGLNLAQYPSILIEMGNMKNGEGAAVLTSAEWRARYAAAVTRGIAAYLSSAAWHGLRRSL
jgi:N-acetylmuramoyl-L-alanine amidase